MYKLGLNDILRRFVLNHERWDIIEEARDEVSGGHYQTDTTLRKILHVMLWWLNLDKVYATLLSLEETLWGNLKGDPSHFSVASLVTSLE